MPGNPARDSDTHFQLFFWVMILTAKGPVNHVLHAACVHPVSPIQIFVLSYLRNQLFTDLNIFIWI